MANQILPDLLHQVAVYWPVGDLTEHGRRSYDQDDAVEIPVHWTNEVKFTVTQAGQTPKSTSRILTSYEVKERGVLWLSTATSNDAPGTALAQKPATVPTNQTIEHVERHFSVSADEVLYKAFV